MKQSKFYNVLVSIDGEYRLAHKNDVERIVSGEFLQYGEPSAVRIEDGYATTYFPEDVTEADYDDIYEEDENGEFEFEGAFDDEVKKYRKADFVSDWVDGEYQMRVESEHGISTSYYYCHEGDIVDVKVYEADDCVPQDYPNQEAESFYKVVEEDGTTHYIKRTSPFYEDEHDYVFEEISKEEFDEYDK